MDGHRLAVILTTMSRENHSVRRDVTCRTNECMALKAPDHCLVRDYIREDQLSTARRTTHRLHALPDIHPWLAI